MKIPYAKIVSCALLGVLGLAVRGCAAPQRQVPAGVASPTQQRTADQARDRRGQAYSLAEMAERRELEADLLARERGDRDPLVEEKRRVAAELRAAAEEADAEARQLRRQVPHGMVQ
jgi:hypothetical protein